MKLTIKDTKGNNQGELDVKFELVEGGRGTQAVHDTVVAYRAAQRMGTAHDEPLRLQIIHEARERLVTDLGNPNRIWAAWQQLFESVSTEYAQ